MRKQKLFLGLRNTITTGKKWYYLFFYEFDNKIPNLNGIARMIETKSWICYSTKKGYHLVVLSPCSPNMWGLWKNWFDYNYKSYYNGQTIRLSRKKNENQELVALYINGYTIPNLYNIYADRFGLKKMKLDKKYKLVFERYWSVD